MPSTVSLALGNIAQRLRHSKGSANPNAEKYWRAGDLSYKFWPVQHKMAGVLEAPIDVRSLKRVLNCSRRIRKTTTALIKSTELCLRKSGAQVRFVAPTQRMLRKIIRPIMVQICEDAPADLKPIWRGSEGSYLFPSTGAELHIGGANNDHEDDNRGTFADLCVVDEAQLIKRLKYLVDDVLMPQLMDENKPRGALWMLLTPPKTPVHECRGYVIEAQANNCYGEFNIMESGYSQEVIAKFCEEAGGEKSTTWLREYMCQFVVDLNYAIVPEWQDSFSATYAPDEFYKFYFRYEGLDIGTKDLTVNIYGVYDFKKAKLMIQDETVINGPKMTTEGLAKQIKDKEAELWCKETKVHLRIADNSNLILLQDLALLHGITFAPTSKDTLEAMVNNLRIWVGSGKVQVDPKCKQMVGCLKYGVWDDKRVKWEKSTVYGHFDALAALMYLVRYVDIVTNPIPRDYGIKPDDMHYIPEKDAGLSDSGSALKRLLLPKRGRMT